MVTLTRRLLNPPIFPDEEKTRVAGLLNIVLLSILFIMVFDAALLAVFAPETIPTFWINGVVVLFALLCLWMMRCGEVLLASIVLILGIWSMTSYYVMTSGGVTSPAFGFLIIFIIIGAALLGARGAMATGLLCLVTAVGLFIAGNNGLLVTLETPPTPARLFATHSAIFVTIALLTAISVKSVRDALNRARLDERMLAERNRELQRLAAILEATSDFVGISDPQGMTLYVNRAGRRLMGLDETADLSHLKTADFHPSSMVDKVLHEALPTALSEGVWSGETALLTRAGVEIPVSQVVIAHRDSQGSLDQFSTIIRDVSERKRAEQERLELALQKERFEMFKEFLGNISHDIKTPLAIINSSLYLLEKLDDPLRRKEKIDNIRSQTVQVEKYIQDILTLSRLDHAPDLSLKTLDMNQLLNKVQTQLTPAVEGKSLSTELKLDSGLPPILADEQELYRAMVNIVENAVNYTPRGGSVIVQTFAREGGVVTEISDTGIGIPVEDIPHIFDRFYRAGQARMIRSDGTGLGLAIVKRIVEIHKGKIEVESQPGTGTTFRVWLPCAS